MPDFFSPHATPEALFRGYVWCYVTLAGMTGKAYDHLCALCVREDDLGRNPTYGFDPARPALWLMPNTTATMRLYEHEANTPILVSRAGGAGDRASFRAIAVDTVRQAYRLDRDYWGCLERFRTSGLLAEWSERGRLTRALLMAHSVPLRIQQVLGESLPGDGLEYRGALIIEKSASRIVLRLGAGTEPAVQRGDSSSDARPSRTIKSGRSPIGRVASTAPTDGRQESGAPPRMRAVESADRILVGAESGREESEVVLRKVIDGITLNQALDLLLDDPEPGAVAQRRASIASYEATLLQLLTVLVVADVVVFDDGVIASGSRPAQVVHDFAEVVNRRVPGLLVGVPVPKPETFFAEPSYEARMTTAVDRFSRAVTGLRSELWASYISRDITRYLGTDTSLQHLQPPLEYVFAGRRDFFVTPTTEAQARKVMDAIKGGTIDRLVSWAHERSSPAITVAQARPEAIAEFCRRSIFAHLLTGENLVARGDTAALQGRGVLSDVSLCPTRASLLLALKPSAEEDDGGSVPLVMPYVMADLLERVEPGPDLCDRLCDRIAEQRLLPEYKILRQLLKNARVQRTSVAVNELKMFTRELIDAEMNGEALDVQVYPERNAPVDGASTVHRAQWAARRLVRLRKNLPGEGSRTAALRRRQAVLRRLLPHSYGTASS